METLGPVMDSLAHTHADTQVSSTHTKRGRGGEEEGGGGN